MNIICQPQTVKILTDENWGSTWESNINSMVQAMYACKEKDSVFKNPEETIKKYVFEQGHYSVLDFTNLESPYINPKSIRTGVNNTDKYESIKLLFQKNQICFNRKDPKKRLMLGVEINQDTSRKYRTEGKLKQLSLTGTEIWNQIKSTGTMRLVSSDLELMEYLKPQFVKSLKLIEEAEEEAKTYYLVKGFDPDYKPKEHSIQAQSHANYAAKHFLPTYCRVYKVMAGSVQDFQAVCLKRKKSPAVKQDVIQLADMILNAIEEWQGEK